MEIDWEQFLQQHPPFSTIRERGRVRELVETSKENTYARGENIVRQGEIGSSLFVIGSGSAEVLLATRGGEPIELSTIGKGEVFGEMSFLEHGRRAATVRAKESCTVLEIRGRQIQKLVKEYPDIGSWLLVLMGERLRQTNDRVLDLQETVDKKIELFNKRLETDQRVAGAELKAAQTVFDQIKLRTDEVISSAERSRDRLNKSASFVGAVVTILVTILGVLGFREVLSMGKLVEQVRQDAGAVEAIKKKAEDSMTGVQNLQTDLRNSKIAIYRTRFFEALDKGSPGGAREAYNQIKELQGLDGNGLETLLRGMVLVYRAT